MLTRLRTSKFSLVLSAFLAVTVGCANVTTPHGSSSDDVSESTSALTLRVTTPQGAQDIVQTQSEIDALLDTCSMFLVDGQLMSDCGMALTAQQLKMAYADGSLELRVEDNVMRPAGDAYAGQIAQVSWDLEYRSVTIQYGTSNSQVDLSGIEDISLRRQVAGALSLQSFASDAGFGSQVEENTGGVCIVIGILAVSWLICATVGTKFCSDAATAGCGAGNVAKYAQICGVGKGVKGDVQFGFQCEYLCKGCAL